MDWPYRLGKVVHESAHTRVYQATDPEGHARILKRPAADEPPPLVRERYRREAAVLQLIDGAPHVVPFLGLEEVLRVPWLVFDDLGSLPLAVWWRGADLTPAKRLEMAIHLARAVESIHARGVMHRAVRPEHVLAAPDGGAAWLIDFQAARRTPQEIVVQGTAVGTATAAAYLAPELTGRMNRPSDSRADLYALGATLYHLMTGRPPFAGDSVLELVHAHLARRPVPPSDIGDVPARVSQIILALLEKEPSARYQSAHGVVADLTRCREGEGVTAPLGSEDHPIAFTQSPGLYGTEAATHDVLDAWALVRDGGTECVLLVGESGTGRTASLREVRVQLADEAGFVLSGDWGADRSSVPYAGLMEAVDQALTNLLERSDEELAAWRQRVRSYVGVHEELLTRLPHGRTFIGGEDPGPRGAAHTEAATDWARTLHQVLAALAEGAGKPVLLTLDNLDAADDQSLGFLGDLMAAADAPTCLVAAASRPASRLLLYRTTWSASPSYREVPLAGLARDQVAALVADSFHRPRTAVGDLAQLLLDRSQGNPALVRQLLDTLARRGGIGYDAVRRQWTWDADAAQQLEADASVVDLLIARVSSLPPRTRKSLAMAAVLGVRWEGTVLGRALAWGPAALEDHMASLVSAGLLYTVEGAAGDRREYAFTHPDLQRALYRRLSAPRRRTLDLAAARALSAPDAVPSDWPRVVQHYRAAGTGLTDPAERLAVAGFCLKAAEWSSLMGAFHEACQVLAAGIGYLPPDAWSSCYRLALDLHASHIQALLADHQVETCIAEAAAVKPHAQGFLDRAAVLGPLTNLYTVLDQPAEVQQVGVEVLAGAGIALPTSVTPTDVDALYRRVRRRLKEKSSAAWQEWIAPDDPTITRLHEIFTILANVPDSNWANYVRLLQLDLALDRGWDARALLALFAPIRILDLSQRAALADMLGLADLALALSDRLPNARARLNLTMEMAGHLVHFRQPLRVVQEWFARHYDLCWHDAVPAFGLIHAPAWVAAQLAAGFPLAEVEQHLGEKAALARSHGVGMPARAFGLLQRTLAQWRGTGTSTEEPPTRGDAAVSIVDRDDHLLSAWLMAWDAGLEGDAERVRRAVGRFQDRDTDHSNWLFPELWFWDAWSLIRLTTDDPELARGRQARVSKVRRALELWAEQSPANYRAKALLLQAEVARQQGRVTRAADRYDQALAAARHAEVVYEEAFIAETIARFYTESGFGERTLGYWLVAYRAYQRWGHRAKVDAIAAERPDLAALDAGRSSPTGDERPLDLDSVVQSASALAQEMQLDRLVRLLVSLALESAGADRGALVLNEADGWRVEAVMPPPADAALPHALIDSALVSRAVVQYVIRTGESVTMDEVADGGRFGRDRYLRSAGVSSLLCVPVAQQGRVVAVLYLENRLTARAFPPERLALVNLLAGQAAISIENARAYASLEQRVAERTRELEAALDTLQNTQRQMVEAEKMASLGQLTAGVAHEINNPVNFVVSSVPSLRRDLDDLRRLMAAYETALAAGPAAHPAFAAARELRDTLDGDYLQQEVGDLLAGIAEGADRTAQIVKGLRYFSRLDEDEVKAADVRDGLDATLMLLRQQYQSRITVERQYEDVPAVEYYPGQLNQLFMNLLVNAGQAIKGPGTVTVVVRRGEGGVAVTVRDTGPGIPPEVQRHIFEPFFTTKPVGEGTGLGLSISYGIIERHHGTIQLDTAPGRGTAFTVWLPLHQPTENAGLAEPG